MCCVLLFFFQSEDGIRYLVRSRGLGDVYKRQGRGDGEQADDGERGEQQHRVDAGRPPLQADGI